VIRREKKMNRRKNIIEVAVGRRWKKWNKGQVGVKAIKWS
jgi:hypothetical protein